MKQVLIFVVLLGCAAGAQGQATLPQNWVKNWEYIGTTSNTVNFPAVGTGGSWTCGASNFGPYTANNGASCQQAINDVEACRASLGTGTLLKFPHGSLCSTSNGFTLPQTAGDTSTNFIVINTDTPLPTGQTVCSHGIQDNLPNSTQPGIRNLGCNGTSMSYQLANVVTPVSGAFTLANGTATNTSAYNDIASMYTFECSGVNCTVLGTAAPDVNGVGPHHYAILNAELRPQAGNTGVSFIAHLGDQTVSTLPAIPTDIHFGYDYLHGDWTDAPVSGGVATGPATGANLISSAASFGGCINCSFMYSYIDRNLRPGSEGHGLLLELVQQFKNKHNWIEGGSIGLLAGGSSINIAFTGFEEAQDVEDCGNRYTYPYSWMLSADAGFLPNNGTNSWVRKNAHEQKFSKRYLNCGNIYENVDGTGGQAGNAGIIWSVNCSGGAFCTNYWTTQEDSTFENNIIRNACKGFVTQRGSMTTGSGGGISLSAQRETWQNLLQYSVGPNVPGCEAISSPYWGFRSVSPQGSANQWSATVLRDGAGLTTTLTLVSQGGGTQSDMNVGDPVQVLGCSDPSFNTTVTALGPGALAGTLPTGLTVVYSNPGTPGAGAGVTGCIFQTGQGYPQQVLFTHNSQFVGWPSPSGDPYIGADNTSGAPLALQRSMTFTNSILLNGGFNGSFGEGTRSETQGVDPATELAHHLLLSGRDALAACPGHSAGSGGIAACYTECPTLGGCTAPPTTIFGPPAFCTTNDPVVENCAGIVGAMSQSSFPINLSDWHQYRLCKSSDAACNNKASLYATGQARQASDGIDLGVNVSALDAAQTSTLYTCASSCGSGPFSDIPAGSAPTLRMLLF